ncbi:MAG: hypothetical protein CL920_24360 [Deltaproteobacteria bacterium]|nr:hypothetical protein [Deltaproteobacteria bacterium]MBU51836.1 hypothetical protein [Deltaproteobacteria bacterium]
MTRTYTSKTPKLGPNEPCHCGSGKKYKHCHRKLDRQQQTGSIKTQISWKELEQAPPSQLTSLASQFLRQQRCDPKEWSSWMGLLELASEQSTHAFVKQLLPIVEQQAQTAKHHFALATFLPTTRQLKRAWSYLLEHIPSPPKAISTLEYWLFRGQLAYQLEHWHEAHTALQHVNDIQPEWPHLWRQLQATSKCPQTHDIHALCQRFYERTREPIWLLFSANLHVAQGHRQRAHDLFSTHLLHALTHTPQALPSFEQILLNSVQYHMPHTTRAMELLDALLQRPPRDPALYDQRITLALPFERWNQIKQDASRWNTLAPAPLARCYEALAQYKQHIPTSITPDEVLRSLPDNTKLSPIAWLHLLYWLCEVSTKEAVHIALEKLSKQTDETPALELVILSILEHIGDFEGLKRRLTHTSSQGTRSVWEAMLWGTALLYTGDVGGAIEVLAPLWSHATDTQKIFVGLRLAEAYLIDEQSTSARDIIDEIEKSTDHVQLPPMYWSLKTHLSSGKELLEAYEQLLIHHPSAQQLADYCAQALQQEEHTKARQHLDLWGRSHPLSPALQAYDALLYWLSGDIEDAQTSFAKVRSYPPQTLPQYHALYKAAILSQLEQDAPLDALSLCEALQQAHESDISSTDAQTKEVERLRRQAAKQLIEEAKEVGAPANIESWKQQVRDSLRMELRVQQQVQEDRLLQKEQLLRAERQHLALLTSALQPQLPPTQEVEQQTLTSVAGDAQTLWEACWPTQTLLRLPPTARQFLEEGEQLFVLFEGKETQDHSPIVLQWCRAAEEALNRKIVDPIGSIALSRLGLHPKRDLPALAGRPLATQGNLYSLGSIPYLLADYWEYEDPQSGQVRYVYNQQVTAAHRTLWEGFKKVLRGADVGEEDVETMFETLPAWCQQWAQLRNVVVHGGTALSRSELIEKRRQYLEQTPNLFTYLAQIPPLSIGRR